MSIPQADELGRELAKLDRDDLERMVRGLLTNGVALSFHGKRTAMEIARRVRPRVTRREAKLHVGPAADQARNLLIEGENLQAMVTLYKYRGEVDLILTDPLTIRGSIFDIMTGGIAIQMTLSLAHWSPRKMGPATLSG